MSLTFDHLRVITFESERSDEMHRLVERWGGQLVFAPSGADAASLAGLGPLRNGIRAVADGDVEVMVFTNPERVRHVLQVAREMGLEQQFREAARGMLIGSLDPACSDALTIAGLGFDFEPDGAEVGHLIRGLARSAGYLLERKRASLAAGVDVTKARRVDLVWPAPQRETASLAPWHDSVFMRACRREPVPYTPIWLMRQAGRYQREYRELREKVSFLELCKTPELAAEVTLMAVDQLGVDAAIIFADILLILEPMGGGLAFNKGEGPSIAHPVRTNADVDALREVPVDALGFVYDAIRLTRRALKPDVPLIGFCGAPFTVASYMIEGGGSRNFVETKTLMYRNPGAWHALMERLVVASAAYLKAQIAAGAQAVQVFDSWVGCLSEADYREFVLPYSRKLIEMVKNGNKLPRSSDSGSHQPSSDSGPCQPPSDSGLREPPAASGSRQPLSDSGLRQLVDAPDSGPHQPSSNSGPRQLVDAMGVPVIHFGADSGHLLAAMRDAGGDVIGLDWRTDLDKGWQTVGYDRAVQGNLDPAVLFASPAEIERHAKVVLDRAALRPGHIFNLGHGILPGTPVEHVTGLVDFVHEHSRRAQ